MHVRFVEVFYPSSCAKYSSCQDMQTEQITRKRQIYCLGAVVVSISPSLPSKRSVLVSLTDFRLSAVVTADTDWVRTVFMGKTVTICPVDDRKGTAIHSPSTRYPSITSFNTSVMVD